MTASSIDIDETTIDGHRRTQVSGLRCADRKNFGQLSVHNSVNRSETGWFVRVSGVAGLVIAKLDGGDWTMQDRKLTDLPSADGFWRPELRNMLIALIFSGVLGLKWGKQRFDLHTLDLIIGLRCEQCACRVYSLSVLLNLFCSKQGGLYIMLVIEASCFWVSKQICL